MSYSKIYNSEKKAIALGLAEAAHIGVLRILLRAYHITQAFTNARAGQSTAQGRSNVLARGMRTIMHEALVFVQQGNKQAKTSSAGSAITLPHDGSLNAAAKSLQALKWHRLA